VVDVRPFRALRPVAGREARVLAPPYDVVDTVEARAWADGDPDSFFRVSRPEIELGDDVDPHSDEVYALGRRNLDEFVARGVLERDPAPTYSIYRLVMGEVVQTGVVAAVSVDDYELGRVRIHEFTRPDKELDRVRHIDALGAQDEPVFLIGRRSPDVDAIVARVTAREPRVDLVTRDGVGHTLWVVDDPAEVAALHRELDESGALYVADGHHRSAAASRVHALRSAARAGSASGSTPGSDAGRAGEDDAFLAVVFPLDDVHVMAYNRVVADLAGRTPEQLLEDMAAAFEVVPAEVAVTPSARHEFGVHLDGRWWVATARDVDETDLLARLDVEVLQDRVLGPLLGIGDPRTDTRIAFVGGIRGTAEIERLVASGRAAVGFTMYPTSTRELVAVADAGEVMPPKSTWFEPKLASGLVLHPID
jgi:uncharacterized protein (DUF1015 family)